MKTAKGNSDMVMLPIDELHVGAVCRFPLEDDNGLLLLGAGTTITAELIQGLIDRDIEELAVSAEEIDTLRRRDISTEKPNQRRRRSNASPRKDETFRNGHPSKWAKGIPLKQNLVNRHHESINLSRREVLRGHVKLARDEFEQIRIEISSRKLQTIEALKNLSAAFASAIVDDHDQTVADVISAGESMSLTDRSVKLSVLGMAVGTELGLDGPTILEIGTTGLLHDIGLYTMDPGLIIPGRGPLNDEEMWEYRKHPINSSNCLREVSEIPRSVLIAIEQVHEQFDGSGYPFGIEGKRANLYARILNVCDTYLRLTIGTSFRSALVPHDALGIILYQARYRLFDPEVVRAFLRVESLFPLGSRVQFNQEMTAEVIRRPLEGYAHPVLQCEDGTRIDLTMETEAMVHPVADPARNQARLPRTIMETMRWSPADELIFD
ncbi:HD-GYP domain-containing protein (c-di-GMP phosphodiesterase class II) [Rhodopirellula rubra]|uniref:HD-GYP domain-containing protein (C-di-GMP phosphodiesterase class II) n=1 Tax=Aporhodopirellula rubra TaxID=980271 RepID=A0A7W5E517_9BACT|nr:HD domain-containing phosphohydrolase [Aporhodopirellula rubra]MBB3210314.1 HD-GYP domain-containing protein (c-di-GMP phosphodiesterase class II) [Aporhodopirellula rubra]